MFSRFKFNKVNLPNLRALFAQKEENVNGAFVAAVRDGKKISKVDFVAKAEIFPRSGLDLNKRVRVPKSDEGYLYTVVLDADGRWFSSKGVMGGKALEFLFSEKDMKDMVADNQIIIRKFS